MQVLIRYQYSPHLDQHLDQYTQAYLIHPTSYFQFTPSKMKCSISFLISKGVLVIGITPPLCPLQEPECGAGHGGELRGGPGLHHREDHLSQLPYQWRGAQLQQQPEGGGCHAALQARRALPGETLERGPPSKRGGLLDATKIWVGKSRDLPLYVPVAGAEPERAVG